MILDTKFTVTDYEEGAEQVFCPFCKKKVAQYYIDEIAIEPCDHFAFFYMSEVGFDKLSKEFKKKLYEKYNSIWDFEFPDSLEEMGFGKDDLHIIDATEYGIACGPVSFEMFYVFDKTQKNGELDDSFRNEEDKWR
jgi:hypothetical protein